MAAVHSQYMETASRSKSRFCACGHNRSLTYQGMRNICREPTCECVKHDTATAPKKTKLRVVVEPGPNALARDAAVKLLESAASRANFLGLTSVSVDISAAIACLEGIS